MQDTTAVVDRSLSTSTITTTESLVTSFPLSSPNPLCKQFTHIPYHQSDSSSLALAWECQQLISSDGPVYSLCYLDNKIISAGASKKISAWSRNISSTMSASSVNASGNLCSGKDDNSWNLFKYFDSCEDGVWCVAVHNNHLISGGGQGNIRVWS